MRRTTRIVAAWLGFTAGFSGSGHGIYEILQGNIRPQGLAIASIGPPCNPDAMWNACEPAMTIFPNFLITGILALLLGLLIMLWSLLFVQRKYGGQILILLSLLLLLFGGGFFPPLIGIVAGIAGLRINKPLPKTKPGPVRTGIGRLWPWPLVLFLTWIYSQLVIGHFFNAFMQKIMLYGVALILITLPLSVLSAGAHDLLAARTAQGD